MGLQTNGFKILLNEWMNLKWVLIFNVGFFFYELHIGKKDSVLMFINMHLLSTLSEYEDKA